jgi:hypothetical protein
MDGVEVGTTTSLRHLEEIHFEKVESLRLTEFTVGVVDVAAEGFGNLAEK